MSLEFGAIAIILLSLFITYFLFGRKIKNSKQEKFLYWLKSTIFMAILLFIWFSYKEPIAYGWTGILMSAGLSGLFNFGRSQIGAGL